MKKLNKKGFTLIELLAVIVILGVLLSIAAPAVSKYINSSKKSTYIANVKNYADSVRSSALNGDYAMPVENKHATVFTFDNISGDLEKGGQTSSYGNPYETSKSFVIIVNTGTAEAPKYRYYIAAIDSKGYGIGTGSNGSSTAAAIDYDVLKESNIVQLGAGNGMAYPTASTTITLADIGEVTVDSSNSINNK